MISKLIKNALYRYLKQDIYRNYIGYFEMQKKTPNEIRKYQDEKMRSMIGYAFNTTAYYNKKFSQCGLQDGIKTGDFDIENIPILTKAEIKAHAKEMISNTVDKADIREGHTGGSTGAPITYYYDNLPLVKMLAALRYFYSWCGWQPGEKILHFWGAKQDLKAGKTLKTAIAEYVLAEKRLPAYEYDEATLEQWYKVFISYQPKVIQGYASILAAFAKYLRDTNKTAHNLKGVYSTAEVLYPNQRKIIEDVFGCKVYNQYGCREIPGIACECSHGNMHILPDMAYVESQPDSHGNRLIVSSLVNHAMPLIRYELGDMGGLKAGECECGMPYPMMEMGMCRSNDIIMTPGGKNIYPSYFVHLLDKFEHIERYQFRQTDPGKMILYVSKTGVDSATENALQLLDAQVKQEIDNDFSIELKLVDTIPLTKAGKYRFVVSDL